MHGVNCRQSPYSWLWQSAEAATTYIYSDVDSSYTLQVATYIMLIGQPFALAAGVAIVWTRLFYAERIAKRFKDARAAGVLRVRHRFRDAHEVEICAR